MSSASKGRPYHSHQLPACIPCRKHKSRCKLGHVECGPDLRRTGSMPHVQSPRQLLCFSRDPVRGLFSYHAVVYQVDTDEAHVVGPVYSSDAKLIASYLMRCSDRYKGRRTCRDRRRQHQGIHLFESLTNPSTAAMRCEMVEKLIEPYAVDMAEA